MIGAVFPRALTGLTMMCLLAKNIPWKQTKIKMTTYQHKRRSNIHQFICDRILSRYAVTVNKLQFLTSFQLSMASSDNQLHFIVFPLMAQGHMIPMIDIARLLARHGVIITIVTTPVNADRFRSVLNRSINSGLRIRVLEVQFPCAELGVPEGIENIDMLPSLDMMYDMFIAVGSLKETVENLLEEVKPKPNCIISDMCFPYTIQVARKFNIPRISFGGIGCFSLLGYTCLASLKDCTSESFFLPGWPDELEFTKWQLPRFDKSTDVEFSKQIVEAEAASYGTVVNSFEELEPTYVDAYKKARGGGKLWCIGPVSLCNQNYLDKVERGKKASIDEDKCLNWLDKQETSSVIYACLGSLCNLTPSQLKELALGLEASGRPFIWVMREYSKLLELSSWIMEDGFEERIKGRGLLIHGWAPQVLILSHPTIGGFLTHCGWNSTLEGISAGVPLLTWPLFADQFCNEKLVVDVLKTGVRVGVKDAASWGKEEDVGILATKDDVEKAIDQLMDDGDEGEVRRKRAKAFGEMAKRAVQEGGSSHRNITMLIQDIKQQQCNQVQ